MDYYRRIQQAIQFMESNLQNELKIADIAAKACFSAFHFQRLFQAISGFTVQEYIRKRRLTEAAAALKKSDQNILEVALLYQYNSQEAFTRAFENNFGLTPGKYRSGETRVKGQNQINFLDYQKQMPDEANIHKPVIVHRDKINITGYEYRTNLNNERHYEEIPGFYHHFGINGYYNHISRKISPNMSYGIACRFQDQGDFSFVIGEAVEEFSGVLEEGFVNLEIPEGKYAEFNASGPNGRVQETRSYIYGTWLPNSNYERKEGPDYEITDVMNSSFPDDLKMKIYIPLI